MGKLSQLSPVLISAFVATLYLYHPGRNIFLQSCFQDLLEANGVTSLSLLPHSLNATAYCNHLALETHETSEDHQDLRQAVEDTMSNDGFDGLGLIYAGNSHSSSVKSPPQLQCLVQVPCPLDLKFGNFYWQVKY